MRLSLHHWRLELGAVVGRQRRRHVLRHGWMFGGGAQQQQERCLSSSPSSTASMTSIRLYRILLRQLQSLPAMDHSSLLLQPPLNPRDYGRARIVNLYPNSSSAHNMEEDDNNNNKQSLLHLFSRWQTLDNKGNDDPKSERILQSWYRTVTGDDDWIPTSPEDDDDDDVEDVEEEPSLSVWTTHRQLHEVIRFAFDSSKQLNDPELLVGYQRLAIVAIRSLQDQEFLHYRTSVSTNDQHGVRVVATSRYERKRDRQREPLIRKRHSFVLLVVRILTHTAFSFPFCSIGLLTAVLARHPLGRWTRQRQNTVSPTEYEWRTCRPLLLLRCRRTRT